MFADNMLGSYEAHVVLPISDLLACQSVENPNSGSPELGYAKMSGLDRKP
jgi:hypothetical protein